MPTTETPIYRIQNVPEVGDDRSSRFALGSLPAGWPSTSPAATVAHVYGALIEERKRAAEPNRPNPAIVELQYPIQDTDGTWRCVFRGQVRKMPTFHPCRSGRYRKTKLRAGALTDDVLLGGISLEEARDDEIWKALAGLCHDLGPNPREVRAIADAVAVLVCLRAGVDVTIDELPYPNHLKAA